MEKRPHIVRTKLRDGAVREYVYAYRGGPRVEADPGSPDFEALRSAAIEQHRSEAGRSLAKSRRKAEIAALEETGKASGDLLALAHKLLSNARYRAARRHLPCDLSKPFLLDLLRRQNMRCAVSGLRFDTGFNVGRQHARNLYGPSLDRIDCKRGYVRGNVRVVLSGVNYAINEWGLDEYLKICRAVAEFHGPA